MFSLNNITYGYICYLQLTKFVISQRIIFRTVGVFIGLFLLLGMSYLLARSTVIVCYFGMDKSTMARFASIDGNVRVKHLGKNDFEIASLIGSLKKGDVIETQNANAVIICKDSAIYKVKPNSILTLTEDLKQNRQCVINMKKGRINVVTSDDGEKHLVNVLGKGILIDKDTDVVIDVDNTNSKIIVIVREGTVTLLYGGNKEQILTKEQFAEINTKTITINNLPDPPELIKPENEEDVLRDILVLRKTDKKVEFTWTPVAGAESYNLLISSSSSFPKQAIKLAVEDIKQASYTWEHPLRIQVFWKVQAVTKDGIETRWSKPYLLKFARGCPPIPIEITKVRHIERNLWEIEGKTNPGVILEVNDIRVEVDIVGNFRKDIILPKNREVIVEVSDRSGNAGRRVQKL